MVKFRKLNFVTRKFIFYVLILFCFLIFYFNLRAVKDLSLQPKIKKKCDIEKAKYLIENLCDLYRNQKIITGSLCSSLCEPKNKFEYFDNYKLVDCFNNQPLENIQNNINDIYDGYKTVLIYELDKYEKDYLNLTKKLVLKSRYKSFLDFDNWNMEAELDEKSIIDQLNYLLSLIKTSLVTNYGIKIDKDATIWLKKYSKNPSLLFKNDLNKKDIFYYINLLSVNNFDFFKKSLEHNDKNKLKVFISNLAVLMNQEEYLFYRYFQQKPDVLKIFGSCGHLYAVEYAQSLAHYVPYLDINKRKELSLKFLNLVHNLDTLYLTKNSFPKNYEEDDLKVEYMDDESNLKNDYRGNFVTLPMQMCDVKLDNFGLNEKNELKIIDTDMIHPDSYLFNEKVCDSHDDCHFFDCKSFCDPNKKRCIRSRINNNLQSICEKIFDNPYVIEDALLTSVKNFGSNLHSELTRRLKMCIAPGFYHDSNVKISANQSLVKILTVLLSDKGIRFN